MELIAGFLTPYIYVGEQGILIEGIKSIRRWENGTIVVASPLGSIRIIGKGLEIDQRTEDHLLIKGRATSIEFEGKSK